jgi:DNA-binding MarR family transcriptional regulator
MQNTCRDNGKSWQDSLEPLAQEIQSCATKLREDTFLTCVRTAFSAAKTVQQHLDTMSNNKSSHYVEFALLHSLILNGGRMTPSQIGKEILRSKFSVTRIVNSLEKRGLVRREPYGDDPRTRDVLITRKGIQIVNDRTEYFQKYVISKVLRDLNEKQLEDLRKLLQRLDTYLSTKI